MKIPVKNPKPEAWCLTFLYKRKDATKTHWGLIKLLYLEKKICRVCGLEANISNIIIMKSAQPKGNQLVILWLHVTYFVYLEIISVPIASLYIMWKDLQVMAEINRFSDFTSHVMKVFRILCLILFLFLFFK